MKAIGEVKTVRVLSVPITAVLVVYADKEDAFVTVDSQDSLVHCSDQTPTETGESAIQSRNDFTFLFNHSPMIFKSMQINCR